jgi:succinoglycan biosynthesis transport protein ExoP
MNALDRPGDRSFAETVPLGRDHSVFTVADLMALIKRHALVMAAVFCAVLACGVLYLVMATPQYTATASVIIDSGKTRVLKDSVTSDAVVDASMVDSQVELIKSERVALNVIRELKLAGDQVFMGSSMVGRVIGSISSLFSGGGAAEQGDFLRERAALGRLSRSLTVRREGRSYVLQISFVSPDPNKSAAIANAVAEGYINDLLDAKYDVTKRASGWLKDRIKELSEQAAAADGEVQKFKTENNIVETGRGLMNEQNLTEVSSQLVTSRATTAEARARLDRMAAVMSGDVPDASVADALKNEVITRLRAQYLDLAKREADWSMRYGVTHTAAINLRNEMQNIRANIQNELRRIQSSYQSDYEIAKAREQSLQTELDKFVSQSNTMNQAQIKLRDLESNAQTSRMLYNSFLQRFMEATQQQSFPITDTRIITYATRPLGSTSPKVLLVMAGSVLLGLMAAGSAMIAREYLDNVFRTSVQIEETLGVEALGLLPRIPKTVDPEMPSKPELERPVGLRRIDPTRVPLTRQVITSPFSAFTEALRMSKVAFDVANMGHDTAVLGVVSALPGEGKSTVAANLAQLIAHSGARCVLVDGDFRNPSLTRALAPDAKVGMMEVLRDTANLQDIIWLDPQTRLMFLPTIADQTMSHTNELLSSKAMEATLKTLRDQVDYVIVDLPPIIPVVDVRASGHLFDSYVLVVEWAKTAREVVLNALASAPAVREKLVGALLNKADLDQLRRYDTMSKKYYYHKYYTRYGASS